ncbi:hypothetical protein BDV37DRAFT_289815 [Aspergillus pseudonomiae]|uniref:LysM domain-containing protein n=1 Tax=Aspergillus pseudonomiae TaxID=1506151 RepID=A0A5N7CSR1_9EURO|nr:uncharacterized protein BDV37DRAFT_289815 [Aspergillus pseudonomiae]KAE8396979.1 hypothetical protein BDV37DRAFT_289815 [Aspergillus pseudonomiae]
MAPSQLTLSLLLVLLTTSGNAASTTWETHPSHPTLPGTVPNCNKWYTAKKGDDCSTVQRECGISADDFFRWNPSVSKDCKENFWADTSYCVGVGPAITTGTPTPTVPPSTTTPTQSTETTPISSSPSSNGTSSDSAPSSSPTTKETYTFNHPITTWTPPSPTRETAWPPTKTQPGQPTSCTRWHEVMVGDTCDTITSRYSSWITKEDLLEWNPGLQENCDAPLVGNFLCVMTRPSGYTLTYPNNSTPVVIPTPTPYTPPPPPGMPSKCQIYYHATTGDSCSKILSQYNMPEKLLHEWNPALGPDCKGLLPNYYYCLLPDGFRPIPLTVTTAPAPTQTGIASNCKAWYRRNQSETCSDIVLAFGAFSEEDFKAWNPAVGQQCTGLIDGNWYCVAVPGTPTTRTASVPAFPTSVPRQPNVIKNCTSWWHVSHEDDCYDVARKNGITVDEFLAWNPDVRAGQYDCKILPVDYEVCVGVRPKPPIRGCTPTAGTNTTAPANTTAAYPTTRKSWSRTSWHKTLTTTTVVTKCEDASSSTCATATVTTTRVVILSPPPTAAPPPTGTTTTTFVTSPTNSSSGISSPGASSPLPPSSSCASSSNSSTTPVVPPTTGPRESSSSRPTTRSTQSQDPHSSVTGPPPPAASSTITVTTTITTQCSTTSTADTSLPDDTTLVTATVTTSCSTTSASITSASSSSVSASSASTTSVSSTSEPDYTEIETTTLTTRCLTTSQTQTTSEPSMTIMQG